MKRVKKDKKEENRKKMSEKITEVLELPKEIVLNIPRITMVGRGNLVIENYKGIIEYESTRIRINTSAGIIKISGEGLSIKEITSEDVMINGDIAVLEFLR